MPQGWQLLSRSDQQMAAGQIVPNFILQVGQRPLQDEKVTLAVLTDRVSLGSSVSGCAWRSWQQF